MTDERPEVTAQKLMNAVEKIKLINDSFNKFADTLKDLAESIIAKAKTERLAYITDVFVDVDPNGDDKVTMFIHMSNGRVLSFVDREKLSMTECQNRVRELQRELL